MKVNQMKFIEYRSTIYSVLKCEFGWNGVLPEGETQEEMIKNGFSCGCKPVSIATKLAQQIKDLGCAHYFRQRIDGKPNLRSV